MAALVWVLLGLSLVANALGIWWTARPPGRLHPDGRVSLEVAENRWQRVRGPLLLGVGLALNTVAAAVALLV